MIIQNLEERQLELLKKLDLIESDCKHIMAVIAEMRYELWSVKTEEDAKKFDEKYVELLESGLKIIQM